ncbi:MAG: hypothetical protein WDO73_17555 [Ignavibacteriota bacterium]
MSTVRRRRQVRLQGGGGTLLYDCGGARLRRDHETADRSEGVESCSPDGVDFGSEASLNDAVETAQRADTLVYSILYSDPGAYGIFGGLARRPPRPAAHVRG